MKFATVKNLAEYDKHIFCKLILLLHSKKSNYISQFFSANKKSV